MPRRGARRRGELKASALLLLRRLRHFLGPRGAARRGQMPRKVQIPLSYEQPRTAFRIRTLSQRPEVNKWLRAIEVCLQLYVRLAARGSLLRARAGQVITCRRCLHPCGLRSATWSLLLVVSWSSVAVAPDSLPAERRVPISVDTRNDSLS